MGEFFNGMAKFDNMYINNYNDDEDGESFDNMLDKILLMLGLKSMFYFNLKRRSKPATYCVCCMEVINPKNFRRHVADEDHKIYVKAVNYMSIGSSFFEKDIIPNLEKFLKNPYLMVNLELYLNKEFVYFNKAVKGYYEKNDIVGCCEYLYKESYRKWLCEEEDTVDDITIILVFFEDN